MMMRMMMKENNHHDYFRFQYHVFDPGCSLLDTAASLLIVASLLIHFLIESYYLDMHIINEYCMVISMIEQASKEVDLCTS